MGVEGLEPLFVGLEYLSSEGELVVGLVELG